MALEIFANNFPRDHRPAPDLIGALVASRAVRERRNIVTEVHHIGINFWEEAQRRNLARGPHNISAHYTDKFNVRWLVEAAREG